jgi:hypothetical protein
MRKNERRSKNSTKVWLFFALEFIAAALITYIIIHKDEIGVDMIFLFALIMVSPLFRLKTKLDRLKEVH